jgi:hypothetical protein
LKQGPPKLVCGAELAITRKKAQCSQEKFEALRDFLKKFQECFRGSTTLTKIVRDKIFLTMSNMYFFSLSKDACGF